MPIKNKDNINYSYESSELIEELKSDILEFGNDLIVAGFYIIESGVKLYTNYDFIDTKMPITEKEMEYEGEDFEYIQAVELLNYLIDQDSIL